MQVARRALRIATLGVVLSGLLCSAAIAADVYPKAPLAAPAQPLPAVDGVNAKVSGFGGAADGRALYGGEGSITVPLGYQYGLQIDGLVAGLDSERQGRVTAAATAGHLFWRDPNAGLLGAYGHYFHANAFRGVDLYAGAAEGAAYLGRFTLEGIAGVEGGGADLGPIGNLAPLGGPNIETRFFDVAQLAWYPTDNLKLSVGHSYILGSHAFLFGAEWGLGSSGGAMASLYASGSVNEHGNTAILCGLRMYFGQRDKSLIRRHREDDPVSITSSYGVASIIANSSCFACAPGETGPLCCP